MLTRLSLLPGALVLVGTWTQVHAFDSAPVVDKVLVAEVKSTEKPDDMSKAYSKDAKVDDLPSMKNGAGDAQTADAGKEVGKAMPMDHAGKAADAKGSPVRGEAFKGGSFKGGSFKGGTFNSGSKF